MSNEADTVKLETELEQLTCEQLRQELLDIGENPGPIDLATKQVSNLIMCVVKITTGNYIKVISDGLWVIWFNLWTIETELIVCVE